MYVLLYSEEPLNCVETSLVSGLMKRGNSAIVLPLKHYNFCKGVFVVQDGDTGQQNQEKGVVRHSAIPVPNKFATSRGGLGDRELNDKTTLLALLVSSVQILLLTLYLLLQR